LFVHITVGIIKENFHYIIRKKIRCGNMRRKGYKKENMIKKLEKFIEKISILPLQPQEIIGFGSVLRDKEYLGDLDLIVKFNDDTIKRFEDFKQYFPWRNRYLTERVDKRYVDFYNFMIKLEQEAIYGINYDQLEKLDYDERFELEEKHGKKTKFQEYLENNPEIQQKIEKKFDIDTELLYYCNWTEVTGYARDGYSIGDFQLNLFFQRMFCGKTKGMRLYLEEDFRNHQPIGITLWSKDKPNFTENYQTFLKNREEFFPKEFLFHLNNLDSLIDSYEEKIKLYEEPIGREFSKAIKRLLELKQEFQSFVSVTDNEILNDTINDLRVKTKQVTDKILELRKEHKLL